MNEWVDEWMNEWGPRHREDWAVTHTQQPSLLVAQMQLPFLTSCQAITSDAGFQIKARSWMFEAKQSSGLSQLSWRQAASPSTLPGTSEPAARPVPQPTLSFQNLHPVRKCRARGFFEGGPPPSSHPGRPGQTWFSFPRPPPSQPTHPDPGGRGGRRSTFSSGKK